MAGFAALQLAWELGLYNVVLEGDSLSVINALRDECKSMSSYGHVTTVIRQVMTSFREAKVCHVYREGNILAHSLSLMALDVESKVVWIEDVPPSLHPFSL